MHDPGRARVEEGLVDLARGEVADAEEERQAGRDVDVQAPQAGHARGGAGEGEHQAGDPACVRHAAELARRVEADVLADRQRVVAVALRGPVRRGLMLRGQLHRLTLFEGLAAGELLPEEAPASVRGDGRELHDEPLHVRPEGDGHVGGGGHGGRGPEKDGGDGEGT